MAVKIVTDSTSDITSDLAQELGITVIPLTVFFGHEAFLDRVEISTDDFYRRLEKEAIFPTTTQPAPGVFADVYNKLAEETDEILTIVISSKLSGTYQSATNAKDLVDKKCRIEVIDSQKMAMGLGLIVIAAAQAAQAGANLDEVMDLVNKRQGTRTAGCHVIHKTDTHRKGWRNCSPDQEAFQISWHGIHT